MKKNIKHFTPLLLGIFFLCLFAGCIKNQSISNDNPDASTRNLTDAVSNAAVSLRPLAYGGTSGTGRTVVDDSYITTDHNQLEIKIWKAYTYGEINTITISVDSGFVMVGGGGQVTNPTGGITGVNALLTAAYPVDDGTFSTYATASKDHQQVYYHNLYAYVIGMRLFDASGTAIPVSTVISHLNLSSTTSSPAAHDPYASQAPPSGYSEISGGALIHWTGQGNLLVEDGVGGTSTAPMGSKGKDQCVSSPGTITSYCLSIDATTITGFGALAIDYTSTDVQALDHLIELGGSVDSGYLLAGIGGYSDYDASGFGRLLFEMYPRSATTAQDGSKDQCESDLGGFLYLYMTEVKPN